MTRGLISAHANISQLMPFLHLPVQSGSDRILASMNRQHSVDEYMRIIENLREARPDLALSSDFIVGYPGETDADFSATLDLVKSIGFAQAYSFKYSPRPGTPAASLSEQVSESVKQSRLTELQELLNSQQLAFNHSFVNKQIPVLFERMGKEPGQISGRSPYMQWVHIGGRSDQVGEIGEVIIADGQAKSLIGNPPTSTQNTIVVNSTFGG